MSIAESQYGDLDRVERDRKMLLNPILWPNRGDVCCMKRFLKGWKRPKFARMVWLNDHYQFRPEEGPWLEGGAALVETLINEGWVVD